MKNKIFVALSAFGVHDSAPLELLRDSGFSYSINPLGRRLVKKELIEMGMESEGILAGLEIYDDEVLGELSNLRCISRCGVGIDNISPKKANEKGIAIKNTPDVVIQPVAELTLAMVFDLLRKLSYQTALMKEGRWERKIGNLLAGKKVGVLGLGRIGRKVAEIMAILGTEVYGTDLSPDKQWASKFGVKIVPLNELLCKTEILSINLSISKDNIIKLGKNEFSKMKKGSIIVNTSRGGFIDELALYDFLKEGYLSGAALDVFQEEPYKGKLCELDNVVLTPHIATLTKESRVKMEIEATRNLIDFLKS